MQYKSHLPTCRLIVLQEQLAAAQTQVADLAALYIQQAEQLEAAREELASPGKKLVAIRAELAAAEEELLSPR